MQRFSLETELPEEFYTIDPPDVGPYADLSADDVQPVVGGVITTRSTLAASRLQGERRAPEMSYARG
jgi:hypothetical protein